MNNCESKLKLLICGDVKCQLVSLFARLEKIIKSAGKFDALFCVGKFFSEEYIQEFLSLKQGDISPPLPIYIVSEVPLYAEKLVDDPEGCEIVEDVTLLGKKGVYSALSGLKVVYVAHDFQSDDDNKDIESCFKTMSNGESFKGVDILLTNNWPYGYNEAAPKSDKEDKLPLNEFCSKVVAKIAYYLKPRYHFTSGFQVYYERPPYRNHRVLQEKNQHITRFIGLADVRNTASEKYIYALQVTPMDKMPINELTHQPSDCTENPYFNLLTKGSLASKEQKIQTEQYFYDIKNTKRKLEQAMIAKKKREAVESGETEELMPKNERFEKKLPGEDCWFCLGNPKVEKHLIVSIGTHVYLALPRGPLAPEHVLILTVGHHQSYLSAPRHVQMEIDQYKIALTKYFRSKNLAIVCFERNFKTQHYQMQVVPVGFRVAGDLKKIFLEISETDPMSPCPLLALPKNAILTELCRPGIPYFYVELPTGEKLFNQVPKNKIKSCNLQFGRHILAGEKVLNCPEKINWRDCVEDKEKETELATKMRQAFCTFEPITD